MSFVRLYPTREAGTLHDGMSRMMDELFRSSFQGENGRTPAAWMPPVDIYETENEVVLKADLPEVDEKKIDIHVEDNVMVLKGERELGNETSEENYLRVERKYGSFSRSFTLPRNIDSGGIAARYRDGVLRVVLPKREESKPRQISVEVDEN
jgi:HSP20 family protein